MALVRLTGDGFLEFGAVPCRGRLVNVSAAIALMVVAVVVLGGLPFGRLTTTGAAIAGTERGAAQPPTPVRVLRGHTDQVVDLAFSDDGTLLASVGADRTLRIWDTASGREVRALRAHDGYLDTDHSLWRVAFSPNAWWVAASGGDGAVRIWEVDSGRLVALLRVPGVPDALAFASNGHLLAVAGFDRRLRLLHPENGRTAGVVETGPVEVLVFSQDSHALTAALESGQIRVWDVETGLEESGTPQPASARGAGRTAGAGAAMVATIGRDGTISLWRRSDLPRDKAAPV